jgi:OOP family OmpA-OmpF porin
MSLKTTGIAALIAAAGLAMSQGALAQSRGQDRGWYVGGSIGQSEADGTCPTGSSCDFKDTDWKIFGGYRFMRHLAVEGWYADHGEITVKTGAVTGTAQASTFGVAAVGILPLGGNFELFGKLGIGYTNIDATGTGPGVSVGLSDSGSDILFGVGALFNFTRNLGVRAEYERYNDSEINVLSIGVQYRF